MHLNSCDAMRHVPEIKLIRTDTTLDLSQKAEKVWLKRVWPPFLYGAPTVPVLSGKMHMDSRAMCMEDV